MKILHLNNSDSIGGAARACHSIHQSLLSLGVDSKILVQFKNSNDPKVCSSSKNYISNSVRFTRKVFDYLSDRLYSNGTKGRFSVSQFGADIVKTKNFRDADIIHMHWINENFISLNTIEKFSAMGKPVVWTLHDMWAFTGGCHYSLGCEKYKSECRNCPGLRKPGENDISNSVFRKKEKSYAGLNLNIVTCSNWLAGEAKQSSLIKKFAVRPIPNPIDIDLFAPKDKSEARRKLNLPLDKFLVLFGTMTIADERKGASHFISSLKWLAENHPELTNEIELVVFGAKLNKEIAALPFKIHTCGRISSDSILIDYYNSADVFCAPSVEDNLPNTVMESLACGVPVIAFNIGGMPDMIEHKQNGWLASPFSQEDFAEGIFWIYERIKSGSSFEANTRDKVLKNFTPQIVAQQYLELYNSILENSRSKKITI